MNKNIPIISAISVLTLIIGGILFTKFSPSNNRTGQVLSSSIKTYSIADIATHQNSNSCWTIIDNNVYDLTSFISRHPGGPDMITSVCGTNGTSTFNSQHGGDTRKLSVLDQYLIGTL